MNEVIRQLKDRRSLRVFEDKAIPEEIKKEIIHAAFEAPTAGGMMLYSIIDISDQALKEKLAVSCDHQPFLAKAPLILVFLADYQRWYDAFCAEGCEPRKPGEGDFCLAYTDAVIAAQNSVVAAESFGIGSCYIGDIIENKETVQELLQLPDYTVPAAMLVYGYPAESQFKRRKPVRFEEEYIVHENQYRSFSKEEHEEMNRVRNEKTGIPGKDPAETIKATCTRKYNTAFSVEMSRSAALYIDNFRYKRTDKRVH